MLVIVTFGAVAQAPARYDEFAAWYEQWIGDAQPLIAHSGLLPAMAGDQVLDIACGQGRMSRHLPGLVADLMQVQHLMYELKDAVDSAVTRLLGTPRRRAGSAAATGPALYSRRTAVRRRRGHGL